MISFIEVSANIGAINTKGIKGFFNRIYKLKCRVKVFSQIDKVTTYITNTELEEFIKCMASVRGVNVYNPDVEIIRMNPGDGGYKINIKTPTSAVFSCDIGGVGLEILYEDGQITAGTTTNGYKKYGINSVSEFKYDPKSIISRIINKEMKYVCGQLMDQKEVEYVYGL